ncbi:hypothetical protein Tco_0804366 [Tanacetum coccineum]|uniref:Retroviral polymerase SH3-like domain-containing protein n=1 Tax=Tanacetum coccineum TaxID=301880 RepID=A0ABQ5A8M5_9ASTR
MYPLDGTDGMAHVNFKTINKLARKIGHLKPFGCQVTILNTSDHLGKFEGKADEGYLVGYAPNSKAYRVYNLTHKRVEETMNLRFLEDKPNVQGIGHEWYFDLDYLTDSLGYTRFKSDTPAGTQETNIDAGTQDHDSDSEVDEQVIYKDDHNRIAYLGRERGSEDFTDILSYLDHSPLRYALTHDPPVVFDSLVKQFWATATVRPNAAGVCDLSCITIDRR